MMFTKKILAIFIAVLLVFTSAALCLGDTLLRESWSVAEQNGKPIGYGYDQLWKTDNGYRYVSEGTIQLSFMGGKPSIVKQYMESTVDSQFLAKSFQLFADVNGSKTQISGQFSGEKAKVVTTTADNKQYPTELETKGPVYFQSSFVDALVFTKKISAGKEYSCNIYDFETLAIKSYTISVTSSPDYEYHGKKIPVLAILEKGKPDEKILIDASGETYWQNEPKLQITLHKVEKGEVPELQNMEMDALVVPGNRIINTPFRSEKSRIKVTWKDVPFSDFVWEDNRQKIADRPKAADSSVLLEITKDKRDFSGKVTLPLQQKDWADCLGDSQYITPSLPEVKEIAADILGFEKDGWRATQKIVKWVYETIKPDIIPETLTTEQILKERRGKCVEYAVLFAAIARAAGLPTRVAVGERFQDNMWIGHMWNEVWLGEWIAVDPSHNQTAPDALLLKFVSSDTVMGTQKVRYNLIGKLGITIEDYTLNTENSSPITGLKTGVSGRIYTNADFRCRFTAPEGWIIIEASEQGLPLIVAHDPNRPQIASILVLFSVPAGTTGDQILSARLPALQNALPGFSLLKREEQTIGKEKAATATYTFEQNGKYQQQNWVVIHEDVGYLLIFTTPLNEWENRQETFQLIRDQFNIL